MIQSIKIMVDEHTKAFPNQKQLEREIQEYLSKKYGDRIKIISQVFQPQTENEQKPGGPSLKRPGLFDHFFLKPEELVAYLDEYVIRQENAKDILATKICTHFHRIRYTLSRPDHDTRETGRIKSNVLLIGPTGVGKTYLVKLIADKIGVPFVKGDATKFSETGYVGGDVEDLVRDLVEEANGDLELAQYGIIYLDEIDKIAATRNIIGADVSRAGVQRALLKLMEETEVDMKVPHDPISMIETIERYRATGKREKRTINTKNILFIVSGAFSGLEEIIEKRLHSRSIGFESGLYPASQRSRIFKNVQAEDLALYGFESEFIGRLPVLAVFDELSEEDLYQILRNPNSPVIMGKKLDFNSYGIKIQFEDEALHELALLAAQEHTGARGLVSVVEKTLLPFEKKLPSTDIQFLVVTPKTVFNPQEELKKQLADPGHDHKDHYERLMQKERLVLMDFISEKCQAFLAAHNFILTPTRLGLMAEYCQNENMNTRKVCEYFIEYLDAIHACEQEISKRCYINASFNEDAIDIILLKRSGSNAGLTDICEGLIRIFEYGFRLISQKKGATRVIIPPKGVDTPEQYINELVGEMFHV